MDRGKKKWIIFFACIMLIILINKSGYGYTKKSWAAYPYIYTTYINYSNSQVKNNGYGLTGYLSLWYGYKNNFQIAGGYTHVDYINGTNLNQRDYTVLYSNVGKYTFSVGFHYISTSDELTNKGKIFFFDLGKNIYFTKSSVLKKSYGIACYYSKYNNVLDFYVLQIEPHISFNLGYNSIERSSTYLDIIGDYIKVDKASEIGIGSENYYSITVRVRSYGKNAFFSVGGWLGTQVFIVKNSGFVVYNFTERYRWGADITLGFNTKSNLSLSFTCGVTSFREWSDPPSTSPMNPNPSPKYVLKAGSSNVIQEVFTLSLGYKF